MGCGHMALCPPFLHPRPFKPIPVMESSVYQLLLTTVHHDFLLQVSVTLLTYSLKVKIGAIVLLEVGQGGGKDSLEDILHVHT